MSDVDRIVEAIKRVETGRDTPEFQRYWMPGDYGEAIGPWQLHPAFFVEYWEPKVDCTWQDAFEQAVYEFVSKWLQAGVAPIEIAEMFNVGVRAFRVEGKRNPEYAKRFLDELANLGLQRV